MTLKKVTKLATIVSIVILVLMIVFRNAKSELFSFLSFSLGGTIFYTLLYYLFTTEKIKKNKAITRYLYIFYAISIPLLIYSVKVTSGTDGFLPNTVRIMLSLEIGYLIFSWFFEKWKTIKTLKNEKSKAELSLLKEQINPHFFFNTLNNLYSLIKKDADAAQDYVLKLSDLMRFTIYDSNKENVTLEEEINYLTNFIDLQTSRYHKEIDINFVKNIENQKTKIAPLLFIILLENAFKHGVEKLTENTFVKIELKENNETICFSVVNNFDKNEYSKNKGIGLKNLKERLELVYPKKYKLADRIENNTYVATLIIDKK